MDTVLPSLTFPFLFPFFACYRKYSQSEYRKFIVFYRVFEGDFVVPRSWDVPQYITRKHVFGDMTAP